MHVVCEDSALELAVALHQDLSIPVRERIANADCRGWSEKEGVLFVQPPVSVLESLVAVRLHVDDCPSEDGALKVVPASHTVGRLNSAGANRLRAAQGEEVVPVARGGAMLMRPLLLHASSKMESSMSRRVLHFVFGTRILPLGLMWRTVI